MSLFWKVTRYARAARFWLLLALAALAWLGFGGEARSQEFPGCFSEERDSWCANQADAWAAITERIDLEHINQDGNYPRPTPEFQQFGPEHFRYFVVIRTGFGSQNRSRSFAMVCPPGSVWDESSKKCNCPSGMGMGSNGQCEDCLSRNSKPGFAGIGDRVTNFSSTCAGGCDFRLQPRGGCVTVGGIGGGAKACSGTYEWTGQSCSVPSGAPQPEAIPDPPKPEECLPAGGGQTVCVKPNGDQCHTASTGRRICWTPGETGDKGDGPTLQTRGPGNTPKPPSNTTTNAGDPYIEDGPPVTTTTTINNTTINTTTQNHRTQHGTNAGIGNQGEPADGSQSGGGDEGDDGSATGGGDCDTPPVVSGDAALNMVANQAWATRCAVEAGNSAAVTGDVGDCKSPFSVEGTSANAEQLRAMRAQICGAEGIIEGIAEGLESGRGALESAADDLMPGEGDSVFAGQGEVGQISQSMFGGGGGSCPLVGIGIPGVGVIDTVPVCSALAALRLLFIAIATIWAIRIVGSQ